MRHHRTTAEPLVDAGRRYRLAIFDFDGTLADTIPWFVSILEDLAERFSITLPPDFDVDGMRGLSAREIVAHLAIPAWKLPVIARYVHALAAEREFPLFRGTRAMLANLEAAGVALAVVSSNGEAAVRRTLGTTDAARFSRFACGAKLFGKARVFASIAKRARVPRDAVICIGDEIRDGEAAGTAGLAFGAVTWGYNTRDAMLRATSPTFVFDVPAQITDALGGDRHLERSSASRLSNGRSSRSRTPDSASSPTFNSAPDT